MEIWLCEVKALVLISTNQAYEKSGRIEALGKWDFYYKTIYNIPVLYDCDGPYMDGVYGKNVLKHFKCKVHEIINFKKIKKIGDSVW